jgi:ribosomal-protein-alanine N-acetyltransferase
VIGLVTMIQKQFEKVEIGYALGGPYRRQGYATEAARAVLDYCFRERHSHRVQAIASSGNPKSWRVMERLGMKLEGRLREANLREGRWCDLLYYGVLADEWELGARR